MDIEKHVDHEAYVWLTYRSKMFDFCCKACPSLFRNTFKVETEFGKDPTIMLLPLLNTICILVRMGVGIFRYSDIAVALFARSDQLLLKCIGLGPVVAAVKDTSFRCRL